MHQALHIFKKDLRHLSYEISLVLLFAMAFAATHLRSPHAFLNDSWLPQIFWFIGAASLVGRVVLAEAIPGDRQFWITRPYRWKSLLGAKLLFIIAFVNLPILLAQIYIVLIAGFPLGSSIPGLLWVQLLLFAFVLPFVAFATLSTNKLFQLILFALAVLLWGLASATGSGALSGVGWISGYVAFILLLASGVVILWIQYQSRRTVLSRWLAAGGVTISTVFLSTIPWTLAFALQSHLSKQNTLGTSLQVGLSHTPVETFWPAQLKPKVVLHIPVSVEGIPDGTELQPDGLAITFEGSEGRQGELNPPDCANLKRASISATAATISALCEIDPSFFQSQHGRRVTLRGTFYFTLFGNAQSQTVSLSGQPSNAPAGLQCYEDAARAGWDVYCQSAFRWPDRLVYAKLGNTTPNSFAQFVSYSPFPADLNIEPVVTRWASDYAYGPAPVVNDVTIIVEEPLAHLHRDFEARAVQLEQFVYSPVKVGSPPVRGIP